MKVKYLLVLLCILAATMFAISVNAADWIYATVSVDNDNHLLIIDVTTGAVTDMGVVTVTGQPGHSPGLTGLSMHTDGLLYAFDTYGNQVLTIDTDTAIATVVTYVGDDLGGWMFGLAIEPNGEYYVTGAQLRHGTLPGLTFPVGEEHDQDTDSCDLAPDGTLYATDEETLLTIDKGTGDQSVITSWVDTSIAGIAVDGSIAWAIDNRDVAPGNQWLVRIDLSTGDLTPLYVLPDGYYLATALPASQTVSGSLDCAPSSGTLPFDATFSLAVANNHDGFSRRMAMRLDVYLANGNFINGWFAGYTNIAADGLYERTFVATIPNYGSTIGINEIVLVMEDVTPAPGNSLAPTRSAWATFPGWTTTRSRLKLRQAKSERGTGPWHIKSLTVQGLLQ